MKIRTEKDVEALDLQIKEELGIDLSSYRNDEVMENFLDILIFPIYIISWAIRPVICAFILYIIGFFVIDLVHIQYLIYAILGLVLFIISGVLFAVIYTSGKLRDDIGGIMEYTLDMFKNLAKDISLTNSQSGQADGKNRMNMLFKGIIHLITLPTLKSLISRKIPLVGVIIYWIVKRMFNIVSDRIKFDEQGFEEAIQNSGSQSRALEIYMNGVSASSLGLGKVIKVVVKVFQLPFKILFVIASLALTLFIYLIW
ncbi:MAG: hypothetical protein AB8B53_14655 [Flavobacteriales bacterium]